MAIALRIVLNTLRKRGVPKMDNAILLGLSSFDSRKRNQEAIRQSYFWKIIV